MTTPTTGADRMRKDFESWWAASGFEKFKDTAWAAWQAAKQTPMVYDPTRRKSILTEEAVEAGVGKLNAIRMQQVLLGDEDLVAAIFHAMEAHMPAWRPAPMSSDEAIEAGASALMDSCVADGYWPHAKEELKQLYRQRVRSVLAAVPATPAAQAQEPEWTSMETPPANGVLRLFCDMKAESLSRTFFVDWVVDGKFCFDRTGKATHWMKLPSFPATTPDPKQSAQPPESKE